MFKENRSVRFPSLPVFKALSIYDLQNLPAKEVTDLESERVNHIATLAHHFGATDYMEAETLTSSSLHRIWSPCALWSSHHSLTPTEWFLTNFCSISSFKVMFSNLKLSAIPKRLPVTNALPERGTSALKRVCSSLNHIATLAHHFGATDG